MAASVLSSIVAFVSGIEPPEKRIHPDFMFGMGRGWFCNHHLRKATAAMFTPESLKIRIFLDEDDLWLLDSCPFMAQIGPVDAQGGALPYCVYLFPHPARDTIHDIAAWAEDRAFLHVAVFSYGHTDDDTFEWIEGEEICLIPASGHEDDIRLDVS